MADKLLLVTTFIVLTLPNLGLPNRVPLWLTILIISRDIAIVLTVAIVNLAVGPRTFRPSLLGKVATALFIVTCVVVLFFNYLGRTSVVVDGSSGRRWRSRWRRRSTTCAGSRPVPRANGRAGPVPTDRMRGVEVELESGGTRWIRTGRRTPGCDGHCGTCAG